jgi:hypothetical protein
MLTEKQDHKQLLKQMEQTGTDPNSIKGYEALFSVFEQINKDVPPGGYLPIWKRKIQRAFFKPKTNWAMLGTLVGLAGLLAMVLLSK